MRHYSEIPPLRRCAKQQRRLRGLTHIRSFGVVQPYTAGGGQAASVLPHSWSQSEPGTEAVAGDGSFLTLRWREMDSNFWYRGTKAIDFRSIPGIAGVSAGLLNDTT